jgi:hypothetical protein
MSQSGRRHAPAMGERVLERDGRYIDAELNGVATGPAQMRRIGAPDYDNPNC